VSWPGLYSLIRDSGSSSRSDCNRLAPIVAIAFGYSRSIVRSELCSDHTFLGLLNLGTASVILSAPQMEESLHSGMCSRYSEDSKSRLVLAPLPSTGIW